jgi:hypothetical protein
MAVDYATGLLDFQVFAALNQRGRPKVVGNAVIRIQDLRDVMALLRDELRLQNHIDAAQPAARRGRKKKRAWRRLLVSVIGRKGDPA